MEDCELYILNINQMNLTVLDRVVTMCREGDKPLRDIQDGLCAIAEYLRVGTVLYDSKMTEKSEDDKDEDEGREFFKTID